MLYVKLYSNKDDSRREMIQISDSEFKRLMVESPEQDVIKRGDNARFYKGDVLIVLKEIRNEVDDYLETEVYKQEFETAEWLRG